jgi:hypothetical protein
MNGTVEPSSSSATAAATCCGLTASSVAIRCSIEGSEASVVAMAMRATAPAY